MSIAARSGLRVRRSVRLLCLLLAATPLGSVSHSAAAFENQGHRILPVEGASGRNRLTDALLVDVNRDGRLDLVTAHHGVLQGMNYVWGSRRRTARSAPTPSSLRRVVGVIDCGGLIADEDLLDDLALDRRWDRQIQGV